MLKIKDNVDLKELEKFGFNIFETTAGTVTMIIYCTRYFKKDINIQIYGDEIIEYNEYVFPRRIMLNSHSIKTFDVLYDLIQAGLVEKVREKKC